MSDKDEASVLQPVVKDESVPKPVQSQREHYDYHLCMEYLEKKYAFKARGFVGFGQDPDWHWNQEESKRGKYKDYWHYICKVYDNYLWRNTLLRIYEYELMEKATGEWQEQITKLLFDEFGEILEGEDSRSIYMGFFW